MNTTPSHLYTFGYEGLDIDAFVARLCHVGVQTVVDVRELPLSRKKGFSKSAFGQALASSGLAYLHVPLLGCPKDIRNRYKADGDWAAYTRDFLAYLATQQTATSDLASLSRSTTSCLVCFEADHAMCHRTYVARAARTNGGLPVQHLTAGTAIPDSGQRVVA